MSRNSFKGVVMTSTIREVSQQSISTTPQVSHSQRVRYQNHYYTSHEEMRSRSWRISKLIQALVLIIFSLGFACFSEQVRTLLRQGLTGKETIKVLVQTIPITAVEESSLEVLELEKILKNYSGAISFPSKLGERYFKLAVKKDFLTKENCYLFKNVKIFDFSEAKFPLNKELVDTLLLNCKAIDIIKLQGLNEVEFSNLRLSEEEPTNVFGSTLNWIETVRYLVHKYEESDRRFWLKIENLPMQLICFMNANEATKLYKILNEQSGTLAKTWISSLSQEIKNQGPTSDASRKMMQMLEIIFKSMPEEEVVSYLSLTAEKELEDKLEIIAPLMLNVLSLRSIQIFITGLDRKKSVFLTRLLSSISSHKNLKIMESKVRVIVQKLLRQRPDKETLSKLYHHEYLRKILMEFADYDQFKELCQEMRSIISSLDCTNQAIEYCIFINSISMNGLKEHFQRVRFFLSSLSIGTWDTIMKESYNRNEYRAQLSIDIWLFFFIALIEKNIKDRSKLDFIQIDDTATVEWKDFAKQLSELYLSGICENSDLIDIPTIIMNSFDRSIFKQTLILSFIEPILVEDQENKDLIPKIFKAFWENEDLTRLHAEQKDYLSKLLLLINSEQQLIWLLGSMKEDHCFALIDLIKTGGYKLNLPPESILNVFKVFTPSLSKDKKLQRTGSITGSIIDQLSTPTRRSKAM